ncbi:MAG: hypothetical protein ACKOFM_02695 [Actinomycetota bacterium]
MTAASRKLRLIVLCPHFGPDIAPTGVVMTRIVRELAARDKKSLLRRALSFVLFSYFVGLRA